MNSYRLLYIQPVGEKGGMEVNLANEIRHLDRTRFTPIVACLWDGPIVADLQALGATVRVISRGRLRNVPRTLVTALRLLKLIKRYDVSLIISQNSYAHIFGWPAAAIARRPTILRIGGITCPDWVDRTAFTMGASAFIANSDFTRGALAAAGVPADRVQVVYRGVDHRDFRDGRLAAKVRSELGLPAEALVVTTVGRLQHGKGQHVALAAAARVVHRFPHARFLIVGGALFGIETHYPQQLQALVQELHLEGHIMMLGHRTDIPAILSASDIVLVPSIVPEGFGTVTIEAMAAGKPVVATDAGASPEILSDGHTGLLVPPDAPEALAEAILRLLVREDLRRKIGAEAQRIVRERFTLSGAVRAYEELYLECIERGSLHS